PGSGRIARDGGCSPAPSAGYIVAWSRAHPRRDPTARVTAGLRGAAHGAGSGFLDLLGRLLLHAGDGPFDVRPEEERAHAARNLPAPNAELRGHLLERGRMDAQSPGGL